MGVVPALRLCYVTDSWCFCPWFLCEYFTLPLLLGFLREKGSHNELYFALLPSNLSLPPSLPTSLSLSLFSSTQFLFFFFFQPPALCLRTSIPFLCSYLLPVGVIVMGLEDVCDVIQTLQLCVRDAAPIAAASCPHLDHLHPPPSHGLYSDTRRHHLCAALSPLALMRLCFTF